MDPFISVFICFHMFSCSRGPRGRPWEACRTSNGDPRSIPIPFRIFQMGIIWPSEWPSDSPRSHQEAPTTPQEAVQDGPKKQNTSHSRWKTYIFENTTQEEAHRSSKGP